MKDLLFALPAIGPIGNEQYRETESLVVAARAFARNSHKCIYIIDYYRKNFLYVSEGFRFWLGLDSTEIHDLGFELYLRHIPDEELPLFKEFNHKAFELLETFPPDKRTDYNFSSDFHFRCRHRLRMVNLQFTPLMLDGRGNCWLALCSFSFSHREKCGHLMANRKEDPCYYEYVPEEQRWIPRPRIKLTKGEHEVLLLLMQGLNVSAISELCNKSPNTVKTVKKSLFLKLKVRSAQEAVACAMTYQLIS